MGCMLPWLLPQVLQWLLLCVLAWACGWRCYQITAKISASGIFTGATTFVGKVATMGGHLGAVKVATTGDVLETCYTIRNINPILSIMRNGKNEVNISFRV